MDMLHVAIDVPFVHHCDKIIIFFISIIIQHGGTWQTNGQPFCYTYQYFQVYLNFQNTLHTYLYYSTDRHGGRYWWPVIFEPHCIKGQLTPLMLTM